jgi:hypothetical protein
MKTKLWKVPNDPPNDYGPELNTVTNLPLGNFSLRIDVQGNLYSAYLNGSATPATTFVSDLFACGYTGVYDHDVFNNGAQSFDNFLITTLSVPFAVAGAGLPGLLFERPQRIRSVWVEKETEAGRLNSV